MIGMHVVAEMPLYIRITHLIYPEGDIRCFLCLEVFGRKKENEEQARPDVWYGKEEFKGKIRQSE